ncbi:hypothetical protein PRUPE_2G180700 [Prunus persica]|uniref:Uncharacterized protein n=1 Tax=Prunus persica TaxID=3760 RepID=A0A251QKV3_PRUPE|nr:uncharacterized protein LOC109947065 [Prunus persica]ONI23295.1 hypothetical protein PRUPE_2G180700 [Prunus persica]
MAMASLLSPSSSNLLLHHLREVHLPTIRPAEVEESSNIGEARHRPASAAIVAPNAAFSFRGPQTTVYAAAYCIGGGTSLCPDEVLLTALPVNGPTRQDAMAAIMAFRLKMTLRHSSSRRQLVDFCFLVPAEGGDQNFVDPAPNRGPNYIPDLNVSPPDATAPAMEFVGEIKSQNISRFIDYVVGYLGEYGSDDSVAEYRKILSSKSEDEIGNLDSIRVWNILTLRTEIQKALVAKGLVEAPIGSDDVQFPAQQQLLPIPQQGWTAALNHAHIHCHVTAAAAGTGANFNGNDKTMSDGRNYGVGYEKQSNVAKRKAVAVGGVDEDDPCCPYDQPMKKPSHGVGGVLWIDEAKALARDKAPIDEAEEEGVSTD